MQLEKNLTQVASKQYNNSSNPNIKIVKLRGKQHEDSQSPAGRGDFSFGQFPTFEHKYDSSVINFTNQQSSAMLGQDSQGTLGLAGETH